MIFGESFEEAEGKASNSTSSAISLQSTYNPSFYLRHCSFQLFSTLSTSDGGNGYSQDFDFTMHTPGLNGVKNSVSFESVNYPGKYISLIGGSDNTIEATRLGIVDKDDSGAYANTTSFLMVAGKPPLSSSFFSARGRAARCSPFCVRCPRCPPFVFSCLAPLPPTPNSLKTQAHTS